MEKKLAAEFIGTFWLVFGGCGAAVMSAKFPQIGVGILGVALAFGLTVLTAAYAVGHISGGHFNPAVTLGLAIARRFPRADVPGYMLAQVAGAVVAAGVLYVIASSAPGFDLSAGFASNGYAAHSPGGYSLAAGMLTEIVLTFIFLFVILGATDSRAPGGFAPLAIGLCLALVNIVAIPVTNASVNPARSTGPAFMARGWAFQQLWMFWVAPFIGAALAGIIYPMIAGERVHRFPAPSPAPVR